jgi:DNA-binding NtrC family response regulator
MVVDDEPSILGVLEELLNRQGFKVFTAKNGKDAIDLAAKNEVDLVLLDMAMPILNGIETLIELKKIKPDILVIMMTAYRDAEKVVEALKSGACDCIFKPFDLKNVIESIKSTLSNNCK